MNVAAFDLETAKVIPYQREDWSRERDLGIGCAALATTGEDVRFWEGVPRLDRAAAGGLVDDLRAASESGATIVTWNGCAFDFRVLAEASGRVADCARLAVDHVDLMLMVTFEKGWLLGLQKALLGAGLPGKRRDVRLRDGTILTDMDGSRAPELWAAGEREAVLAYLGEDVRQLRLLAEAVVARRRIAWTSDKGKAQSVLVSRLLSVRECFAIPLPDTSWMKNPPRREGFVDWMPAADRPRSA